MNKIWFCILFFFGVALSVAAQDGISIKEGTVTFVTSNNVYVRFDSTEQLKVGDMLTYNGTECLKIESLSSTSAVCTLLNDCQITKDAVVTAEVASETTVEEVPPEEETSQEELPTSTADVRPEYEEEDSEYRENIRGRVSAASYNQSSNVRENRSRIQGVFSLAANHINDSKISAEAHLAYRAITATPEDYSGRTSIFNVYNLNARYDVTTDFSVTAGRKINPKATSLGANDGLIAEKYFGNFYAGVMGGFRPDIFDYGFNSDLLQYGGYVGIETNTSEFYSQTTLGAMEQTNGSATDRRYIYFQHNSTIASNLNLFSTMELDIFGGEAGGSRLTNLYLSARYRFSRAVNAMISYDSRKQIIYYQTFQTQLEQFLDDDLARQGLRLRLNVRPAKIIWLGASYSSRFQSDSQNASDNVYGYATLTKIPSLGGRLNLSYNMNTSRYLTSNIASIRYSRDLVKSKVHGDIYYRNASYDYENRNEATAQNFFGAGLNWNIARTWQFSINGEMNTLNEENNYRFYTRLTKRFYSKK